MLISIFQLAFSSQNHVNKVFAKIENWDEYKNTLSDDINDLDWRSFQQEYRDYIELAKLLQLVPGIGAFVASEKRIIKSLTFNMRSQIFAKSLPMPMVKGSLKRLELIRNHPELKDKLWKNYQLDPAWWQASIIPNKILKPLVGKDYFIKIFLYVLDKNGHYLFSEN